MHKLAIIFGAPHTFGEVRVESITVFSGDLPLVELTAVPGRPWILRKEDTGPWYALNSRLSALVARSNEQTLYSRTKYDPDPGSLCASIRFNPEDGTVDSTVTDVKMAGKEVDLTDLTMQVKLNLLRQY